MLIRKQSYSDQHTFTRAHIKLSQRKEAWRCNFTIVFFLPDVKLFSGNRKGVIRIQQICFYIQSILLRLACAQLIHLQKSPRVFIEHFA